jgi:hypothetical protein
MASLRSGRRSLSRAALLKQLIAGKDRRRHRLARLPIEEKVRIVARMQREVNEIRRATSRPTLPEWPLD